MSNEAPYQANFKTPKGSLLNIRAWSEMELDQALDALLQRVAIINDVELAIDAVCAVNGGGLKVQAVGTQSFPNPDAPAPVQATGYTPAQTGAAPLCEHGEPMRFVPAGISKAGKPYKGFYACARQRAEACNAKG
jgi:hypothetical protein